MFNLSLVINYHVTQGGFLFACNIHYSCSCRNPSTIYNEDNRDYREPTNYITFIIIYDMGR